MYGFVMLLVASVQQGVIARSQPSPAALLVVAMLVGVSSAYAALVWPTAGDWHAGAMRLRRGARSAHHLVRRHTFVEHGAIQSFAKPLVAIVLVVLVEQTVLRLVLALLLAVGIWWHMKAHIPHQLTEDTAEEAEEDVCEMLLSLTDRTEEQIKGAVDLTHIIHKVHNEENLPDETEHLIDLITQAIQKKLDEEL